MRSTDETPLIRVVDDDPSALDGIRFMLLCEGYDITTYPSARSFLTDDMPSRPGCIILDVRMPEMSGLELFAELRRRGNRNPVLFLTGHGDIEMAVQAMQDGAADFLVKPIDGTKLVQAVSKALTKFRARSLGVSDPAAMRAKWATLTEREKEVMRAVAKGWMNKTIAADLDISIRTVEAHRAAAIRKIGLSSPAQLACLMAEIGE